MPKNWRDEYNAATADLPAEEWTAEMEAAFQGYVYRNPYLPSRLTAPPRYSLAATTNSSPAKQRPSAGTTNTITPSGAYSSMGAGDDTAAGASVEVLALPVLFLPSLTGFLFSSLIESPCLPDYPVLPPIHCCASVCLSGVV